MQRALVNSLKLFKFHKKCLARPRAFSENSPSTSSHSHLPKIELAQLKASWNEVVCPDLLAYTQTMDAGRIGTEWYNKVLQHTVANGEPLPALVTAYTFKLLSEKPRPEDTRLSHILGWATEIQFAASQVHDDIVDQGKTRRGVPAWHTLEDVGLAAGNDAILVSLGSYHLLEKYFSDKAYYPELLSVFHTTEFHTSFSVILDHRMQKQNVLTFTEENRNTIVNSKVWISFLPLVSAMHLAGWKDPVAFQKVRGIAMMIGHLFQVQDDFIDVYGDPLVTGKTGSDIMTNKCTWFAITASQLASEAQRKHLGECYGSANPEKVTQVKKLFDELDLQGRYRKYEKNTVEIISNAIQNSSLGRMETVLTWILNKFNRRTK